MNYKAGDTVQIEGCRMNGYEHVWTLTVAEVYPEHYDPATDSFLPFRSTTGHQLWSDILVSKRGQKIGRQFYSCKIIAK